MRTGREAIDGDCVMDEVRKEFEAWVCRDMTSKQRIDLMPRYCIVGEPYMDKAMQARWEDWQAATMAERHRSGGFYSILASRVEALEKYQAASMRNSNSPGIFWR